MAILELLWEKLQLYDATTALATGIVSHVDLFS